MLPIVGASPHAEPAIHWKSIDVGGKGCHEQMAAGGVTSDGKAEAGRKPTLDDIPGAPGVLCAVHAGVVLTPNHRRIGWISHQTMDARAFKWLVFTSWHSAYPIVASMPAGTCVVTGEESGCRDPDPL